MTDRTVCDHSIEAKEVAIAADGYCPLCMEREIGRLRMAIWWALGEGPDPDCNWFGEHQPEQSPGDRPRPYWWRKHLRELSGIESRPFTHDDNTTAN